ncbi:MAG: hypothetical protein IPK53_06075 [bacterium]|nr:hypothetical protein [bacterium]
MVLESPNGTQVSLLNDEGEATAITLSKSTSTMKL